ncbi:hypothetical protein TRM7557_02385 [Tritonibacter multivorans]|uniref:Outer membrane protein beta-barrel domain-containing protein n=1 Tax=Tritonibacter multivorans TaxID=928856 RepID=A0A0P1GYN3_9RHOB|nr:porin [Tritonibacter multivorans]MDA7419965.1 porin [Tritonibacter multivorans]CUH79415.1 hypothetical protein TRM7557_02385 [Tritonibacter multivorans]SFC10076.1 porin [Tritonibacter multivorans]
MKNAITAAAAIMSLTTPVLASETFSGELTLGYQSLSDDGETADNFFGGGAIDADLGNGFHLNGGLNYTGTEYQDVDIDMTVFSLGAGYDVSPNVRVGAFFDRTNLDAGNESLTTNHFGVEGAYTLESATLSAFFGKGDSSDLDLDSTVMGAEFVYEISQSIDLGAFLLHEEVNSIDIDNFGLSAGYDMSDTAGLPIYLNATLGRVDIEGEGVTQFALTATIPLGGKGVKKGSRRFHKHSTYLNTVSTLLGEL